MDSATHAPTRTPFLALDFQRMDPVEREGLREHMECTLCGAAAYFVPRTKRGTCYFGARPHNDCKLGTSSDTTKIHALPEEEERALREGTFRLRPHSLTPPPQQHVDHDPTAEPEQGRARQYTRGQGSREAIGSVGLRSLLTKLDQDPSFAQSSDMIEFPEGWHARVRNFCVNVVDVTTELIGKKKLYWGTIHKPGEARNGGQWLYTQWGSPNVLLTADILQLVIQDNDIDDLEELSGASFIHLGYLNEPRAGGLPFFKPRDPSWFVIRLDTPRH